MLRAGKTLTDRQVGKTALAAVDGAGAGPRADAGAAVDADDVSAPPPQKKSRHDDTSGC